jgi:hypothetical protein
MAGKGKRGRPKGQQSKKVLIKDPLIAPYEIHVDEKHWNYMLVNAKTQNVEGYYTQLPNVIREIMREKYIPNNSPRTYTIREYIVAMTHLYNAMKELMVPVYNK